MVSSCDSSGPPEEEIGPAEAAWSYKLTPDVADSTQPLVEDGRAGMEAAKTDGKHVGWPATPDAAVREIEQLVRETDLSIRKIKAQLSADASRGVIGRVVKRVRTAD